MAWKWTATREKAAWLIAEDKQSDEEIASAVGVRRSTLHEWKQEPEFQSRIAEHVTSIRDRVRNEGLAIIENRLRRLNDDWQRLQQIRRERGESEEMQEVPGGTTGLLMKQIKSIGRGDNFQVVEQYAVDVGLLTELRKAEEQAAKELGQWRERTELTGMDGGPIRLQSEDVLEKVYGDGDADTAAK